jgi:hypothetical protein
MNSDQSARFELVCPDCGRVKGRDPNCGWMGSYIRRPVNAALRVLERIGPIAREHGYAVAVHGSQARDLDLIAVPWTEEASGNRALVDALVERGPFVLGSLSGKPHGRIGYVLHGATGFDYIDLSVTPRSSAFDQTQRDTESG